MPAHSWAGSRIHTGGGGKKGGEGEERPYGGEDIVIQTKRAAEQGHLGSWMTWALCTLPPSKIAQ